MIEGHDRLVAKQSSTERLDKDDIGVGVDSAVFDESFNPHEVTDVGVASDRLPVDLRRCVLVNELNSAVVPHQIPVSKARQ